MGRTSKPGGVHWTTAEQENGELLQGGQPPTYEWYDDAIHLVALEEFMSTPEWRRLSDEIKFAFVLHRMGHKASLARKEQEALLAQREQQIMIGEIEPGPGGNGKEPGGGGPPAPKAKVPAAAGAAE